MDGVKKSLDNLTSAKQAHSMKSKNKSKKNKPSRRLPVAPPTQRKESSKKDKLAWIYDKIDFDLTDI